MHVSPASCPTILACCAKPQLRLAHGVCLLQPHTLRWAPPHRMAPNILQKHCKATPKAVEKASAKAVAKASAKAVAKASAKAVAKAKAMAKPAPGPRADSPRLKMQGPPHSNSGSDSDSEIINSPDLDCASGTDCSDNTGAARARSYRAGVFRAGVEQVATAAEAVLHHAMDTAAAARRGGGRRSHFMPSYPVGYDKFLLTQTAVRHLKAACDGLAALLQ